MKKVRTWIFSILAVVAVLCIIVWCMWGREIRTLASLHQVGDNHYLYYMEYKADYDLDEVVARNIDQNAQLLDYVTAKIGKGIPIKGKSAQVADENGKLNTFNCTSLQARNAEGDGFLYGRNYDYFANPTLVTLSHPKKGYASLAVSDMSHFGYSLDELPVSFKKKLLCLASIYAPVDGINEKGLCTSIMALPHQPANQQTGHHSVGTSIIMRLWLDRCDRNHLLVTNHLLSPKYRTAEPDPAVGNPNSRSWWRYEVAEDYLMQHDGTLTPDQMYECLAAVHWEHLLLPNGKVEVTQYSNIYDQSALTLRLRPWNQYDTVYDFELK